jgi:hypothetical protein
MKKWKWKKYKDINYIGVDDWHKAGINMAFSSRAEGVSGGPYSSLNLGLHVGDQRESVLDNRCRCMEVFGTKLDSMVSCQQVHGNRVAVVFGEDAACGARDLESALEGYDAMISNTPGVVLATFYADCLPIIFCDPQKRVVGVAHSGWKGTMGKIGINAICEMGKHFSSEPSDIEVFIGPGIGECCFEVQEDLAFKVNRHFAQIDGIINFRENKYFWDLRLTNIKMLISCGIQPTNIINCDLCTSCLKDLFYSYRRDNGITGRMGAFIGLR